MSNNELKPAKVAIIGGGNIGVALARGLVNSGDYCASEVIVTRRRESKLNFLKPEGYQVTDNNTIAVANAPTVVLAVLPQQINTVLDEINDGLTDRHLIVSVVSGVSTQNLLDRISKPVHLVRAMPNTAILIGESMTCIAAHKNSQDKIEETRKLFDTCLLYTSPSPRD